MAQDAFVLVVDDDKPSVTMLKLYLDLLGYRHESALNGPGALKIIRAEPNRVGMILLDLAMPEMNGYEVCRTIRDDPELASISVVALTANVDMELEERIKQAGFDALITKPFSRNDLEAALEKNFRFRSRGA